ncbi:MAG: hypothetical protein K2Y13_12340 [Burkholderiaceae bacterium]|uniref:Uncharacterized protein n=1 Tax=Herminiimonas contaminans TaxID=1111140 RepID=A0ABS0EX80_9BURK|nr:MULTISPECIES: hypothetical protein [Oxalobacteraceae]MBF8178694.1 hypothetical protein [Herminiimonas contaminans]MBX9800238.1 hypothetical protein [Burkholderiaceae bacterium]
MSDRKMFADMDIETQRFYSRIINTALFNIYAVDHHLFGSLFCESDDPMIMLRWQEAEPLILEEIRRRSEVRGNNWNDF